MVIKGRNKNVKPILFNEYFSDEFIKTKSTDKIDNSNINIIKEKELSNEGEIDEKSKTIQLIDNLKVRDESTSIVSQHKIIEDETNQQKVTADENSQQKVIEDETNLQKVIKSEKDQQKVIEDEANLQKNKENKDNSLKSYNLIYPLSEFERLSKANQKFVEEAEKDSEKQ